MGKLKCYKSIDKRLGGVEFLVQLSNNALTGRELVLSIIEFMQEWLNPKEEGRKEVLLVKEGPLRM